MRSDISCADAAALQAKGVSVGSECVMVMLRQEWRSILAAVAVVAALFVVVVLAWRRLRRKRSEKPSR